MEMADFDKADNKEITCSSSPESPVNKTINIVQQNEFCGQIRTTSEQNKSSEAHDEKLKLKLI